MFNEEDIIKLAQEAGLLGPEDTAKDIIECGLELWVSGERGMQELESFAALVAAAEREACAKVCEAEGEQWLPDFKAAHQACVSNAAAIRAREQSCNQ